MKSSELKVRLRKRLAPLYIAVFLQGSVLWYAIEKLFMNSIGFTDASIGLMVAAYSAVMLLLETPSGILADRWSRKGVLVLGSCALVLSALVCGLSTNVPTFIVGAAFWGIFFALYSGTYDSIIYDTLLEESGSAESFEEYYGKIEAMDSVGLVLGALAGGLVAELFGLRETFFWSIPIGLLSILALLRFHEPQLHKAAETMSIKAHVAKTFKAVMRKGQLLPVLIVLIVVGALLESVYEFNQLWFIALAMPTVLYGPVTALLLGTSGVGGLIAKYLKLNKRLVMSLALVIMLLSSLSLILFQSTTAVVAGQVFLCVGLVGVSVVFTRLLHDSLDSNVRSGASSAVSTMSRLVFIPFALAFGYISEEASVFNAAWLIFGLFVIAAWFIVKTMRQPVQFAPVRVEDGLAIESYNK